MGNRYHLTAGEGVGLVGEKGREAGGVLVPIRVSIDWIRYRGGLSGRIVCSDRVGFSAGLEIVDPDLGMLVRGVLPRGLSDERDMAGYI